MNINESFGVIKWRFFAIPSLIIGYCNDCFRYGSHSATFSYKGQERLIGRIVRYYHSLEKGLSLKDSKTVFGKQVALRLVSLLSRADELGMKDDVQVRAAKAVLKHYGKHIGQNAVEEMPELNRLISDSSVSVSEGGVLEITGDELLRYSKGNFESLICARRSVRYFDEKSVDINIILKAIAMAQQSPSVCNRQPGRVYYTTDADKIAAALQLQDGNRGFGHYVKALIVVASDLSVFGGPNERNQVFIDGGLFAMTLMYSLTYLGLATCSLNWMATARNDRQLRNLCGIKSSHTVIMLIAAGYPPVSANVAKSCRREASDIAVAF